MCKLAGCAETGEAEICSLCFGNGGQTLATVRYQSAGHCFAVNEEGEVISLVFVGFFLFVFGFLFFFFKKKFWCLTFKWVLQL